MGNYNLISSSQELIGHLRPDIFGKYEKGEMTMFRGEKAWIWSDCDFGPKILSWCSLFLLRVWFLLMLDLEVCCTNVCKTGIWFEEEKKSIWRLFLTVYFTDECSFCHFCDFLKPHLIPMLWSVFLYNLDAECVLCSGNRAYNAKYNFFSSIYKSILSIVLQGRFHHVYSW